MREFENLDHQFNRQGMGSIRIRNSGRGCNGDSKNPIASAISSRKRRSESHLVDEVGSRRRLNHHQSYLHPALFAEELYLISHLRD